MSSSLPSGDRIAEELRRLVDGHCAATLTAEEYGVLDTLLRGDEDAQLFFLSYTDVHAGLCWQRRGCDAHEVPVDLPQPALRLFRWLASVADPRRRPGRKKWWGRWLAAAVLLLSLGVGLVALRNSFPDATPSCAEVMAADGLAWSQGQPIRSPGVRVGPGDLHMHGGTLKIRFDSGALLTFHGPGRLQILDAMHVRLVQGKVITRIAPAAKGFTIETLSSKVVDQGTEFGLAVDDSGATDVVVFDGAVDLAYKNADREEPNRLVKGEALRLDREGTPSRIHSVEYAPGADMWSTGQSRDPKALIQSVQDNITGLGSIKYYQIVHGGLVEDALAYVDRPHEWNGVDAEGIPKCLLGADLVMTFNDDKYIADFEMTVTLGRPCILYVLYNDRHEPQPWLVEGFTDTGLRIGMDEGPSRGEPNFRVGKGPGVSIDRIFSIWQRRVDKPGPITLGALGRSNSKGKSMYGIAAVPLNGK